MATDPPILLEYIKALSTPVIAISAALITGTIAVRQWKTANDKLVLDLFQRRIECYDELKLAVGQIVGTNLASSSFESLRPLALARLKADFLFGDEVSSYLTIVWETVVELRRATRKIQSADGLELEKLGKIEQDCHEKLDNFFAEIGPMMVPYLRMDQKLSRYQPNWYYGLLLKARVWIAKKRQC